MLRLLRDACVVAPQLELERRIDLDEVAKVMELLGHLHDTKELLELGVLKQVLERKLVVGEELHQDPLDVEQESVATR